MNENPLAVTAALAGVATIHLGEPGARSRFPSSRTDAADDLTAGSPDLTEAEGETSAQDVWRRILFSPSPTIS
ncbi:MAG: hypothetical protein U1F52_15210 [Burkholderiales bacterium]